jgi:hypothetical protein
MPADVGKQLDLGRPHCASKSEGFGRTGRYRQRRDRVVASSKALDTLNFQEKAGAARRPYESVKQALLAGLVTNDLALKRPLQITQEQQGPRLRTTPFIKNSVLSDRMRTLSHFIEKLHEFAQIQQNTLHFLSRPRQNS